MMPVLVAGAAGLAFLIGLAIGTVIYLLPRPKRFGFDVTDETRQETSPS